MNRQERRRFAVVGGSTETERRIAMLRRLDPTEISQFYEDQVRFKPQLEHRRPDAAMANAHSARMMLAAFTDEEKEASRNWLITHNYEVPGESR